MVDGPDLLDDQLAGGLRVGGLLSGTVLFPVRARLFLVLCSELVQLGHFLRRKNRNLSCCILTSEIHVNVHHFLYLKLLRPFAKSHSKKQKTSNGNMNYGKTHCDQSVHNIFTGLQAGATRHLQEQFFGRLPDLQRNILNINFKLKSHF